VASLSRETIAFYRLEGVALELASTTSLLERTNRELRRKFSQASLFGSELGTKVAVFLQMHRLNGFWSGKSWWQISQDIWFRFD
jgi:hypothetical protein